MTIYVYIVAIYVYIVADVYSDYLCVYSDYLCVYSGYVYIVASYVYIVAIYVYIVAIYVYIVVIYVYIVAGGYIRGYVIICVYSGWWIYSAVFMQGKAKLRVQEVVRRWRAALLITGSLVRTH